MSTRRPAPSARPGATALAVLFGALLIALAVVTVRDLAVDQGWAQGTPWLAQAADAVDGLRANLLIAVVGVLVALLGLTLLVIAIRPAARTHVALAGSDDDAWITPAAVAALARSVADRSAGVLGARTTKVTPRKVRIEVAAAGDAGSTAQTAQHDVQQALGQLATRPTVTVKPAKKKQEVAK